MIQRQEEEIDHPDGCQCVDCKIERGELSEEELQAPEFPERPQPRQQRPAPPAPPPEPPPKRAPRKRAPTNGGQSPYPNMYTQPVQTPQHHHARYEYAYGPLRKCHLCAAYEDSMKYKGDQVWFATLEDRARHILDVHTDESDPIIKRERQRAKEILGIADIWDRHAPTSRGEIVKEIPPMDDYEQEKKPLLQSIMGGKKKRPNSLRKSNWFMEHKLISVILAAAILYGIYVMYLMSQGYEF